MSTQYEGMGSYMLSKQISALRVVKQEKQLQKHKPNLRRVNWKYSVHGMQYFNNKLGSAIMPRIGRLQGKQHCLKSCITTLHVTVQDQKQE